MEVMRDFEDADVEAQSDRWLYHRIYAEYLPYKL